MLELSEAEYSLGQRDYQINMEKERNVIDARETERAIAAQATAMVDGAGGWLQCERTSSLVVLLNENSFRP